MATGNTDALLLLAMISPPATALPLAFAIGNECGRRYVQTLSSQLQPQPQPASFDPTPAGQQAHDYEAGANSNTTDNHAFWAQERQSLNSEAADLQYRQQMLTYEEIAAYLRALETRRVEVELANLRYRQEILASQEMAARNAMVARRERRANAQEIGLARRQQQQQIRVAASLHSSSSNSTAGTPRPRQDIPTTQPQPQPQLPPAQGRPTIVLERYMSEPHVALEPLPPPSPPSSQAGAASWDDRSSSSSLGDIPAPPYALSLDGAHRYGY